MGRKKFEQPRGSSQRAVRRQTGLRRPRRAITEESGHISYVTLLTLRQVREAVDDLSARAAGLSEMIRAAEVHIRKLRNASG